MLASLARIGILIGISAAAWIFYPKIKPILQPLLANPQVLGTQAIEPVINKVNDLLPDNIQIPTTKPTTTISNGSNQTTTGTPSPTSSILKNVVDEVKQKAADAAQTQIDNVKKETGNAFCAALIETIKKQCGVQ